jgi:UDP-N-acetylmuramoyl-tripeptide--D-alanyl-D-alanine ligase
MRTWTPDQVAAAAGARLLAPPPTAIGPDRAVIDSREAGPGALFIGLPGATADGGRFAAQALAAGAWGVLTTPEHADAARCAQPGVLMAAPEPLVAMQRLATAWRRRLGARVIGVTGSTGKTTTKDLILALLEPHRRTVASRANFNTEIGVPLEILDAPEGTEILVLEMAMRGVGQIAELAAIAEPEVGVIVSIGPVHLELLGTVEAVAATKSELIAGLPPHGTAIVPAGEELLRAHLRDDLDVVTFGAGGAVRLLSSTEDNVEIDAGGRLISLAVPFTQVHIRANLLAAVAASLAVGVTPAGAVEFEPLPGRGGRITLADEVTLVDDCYNANPMSVRAALDDLAATTRPGERRVAVLGDMLELGPRELEFHADIGEHAGRAGVDVLITVGPLAAAMAERFVGGELFATADATEAAALVRELVAPGDVILVKGSRGVGLELVCQTLGSRVAA